MKQIARGQWRRAFTFVEVLAALAFLAILAPVIMKALTLANRTGVMSDRSATAVQLAENQLSELLIDDAWLTADTRGEFPEWPGYRWELARHDWEADDMTELTMSVFFEVQGREQEVRLSTLASETAEAAAP